MKFLIANLGKYLKSSSRCPMSLSQFKLLSKSKNRLKRTWTLMRKSNKLSPWSIKMMKLWQITKLNLKSKLNISQLKSLYSTNLNLRPSSQLKSQKPLLRPSLMNKKLITLSTSCLTTYSVLFARNNDQLTLSLLATLASSLFRWYNASKIKWCHTYLIAQTMLSIVLLTTFIKNQSAMF